MTHHVQALDWMLAMPKPIRHVTRDDGSRGLQYAGADPEDLKGGERNTLTDAHRLLLGARLLRISRGTKSRFLLTRTQLGTQVLRAMGVL